MKLHAFKLFILSNLKGLAFVSCIVIAAFLLANSKTIYESTHLAATAFAILIGAVLSPWFFRYQHTLQAGVQLSAKKLLRLGIILYGFNVTFSELANIGIYGVLLAVIIICLIFFSALILGVKVFKLDKETSMLVGAGSAICGAAAVLALESVLKSDTFKGVVAVGTVVIFGLICMFLYPIAFSAGLIPNLNGSGMGIYMGATLHEVANVAGAAQMAKDMSPTNFSQSAANAAVILKMMRVIMLVPFLLIVSYYVAKSNALSSTQAHTKKQIQVPYFAFMFLGVIVLNTFLSEHKEAIILGISIESLLEFGKLLCSICIVFAMAALGLQIDFKKFIKTGGKAFGLALSLCFILIIAGYFLTLLFRGLLW
ncbi:YeiH family protein [Helicobacter burdigaliensis]|uniref:YeiH family protein n=1 Tax=Helicobacter burdigaliensis TaxID=2315334 RepID=UPI000EF6604C|nr:YeiH family protein [Helicobacter burdigaliensis]